MVKKSMVLQKKNPWFYHMGLALDPEMPGHVGMLQLLAGLGVLGKEGDVKWRFEILWGNLTCVTKLSLI